MGAPVLNTMQQIQQAILSLYMEVEALKKGATPSPAAEAPAAPRRRKTAEVPTTAPVEDTEGV